MIKKIPEEDIFAMGITEGELWIGINQEGTYALRFDKKATNRIIQFFKIYQEINVKKK